MRDEAAATAAAAEASPPPPIVLAVVLVVQAVLVVVENLFKMLPSATMPEFADSWISWWMYFVVFKVYICDDSVRDRYGYLDKDIHDGLTIPEIFQAMQNVKNCRVSPLNSHKYLSQAQKIF